MEEFDIDLLAPSITEKEGYDIDTESLISSVVEEKFDNVDLLISVVNNEADIESLISSPITEEDFDLLIPSITNHEEGINDTESLIPSSIGEEYFDNLEPLPIFRSVTPVWEMEKEIKIREIFQINDRNLCFSPFSIKHLIIFLWKLNVKDFRSITEYLPPFKGLHEGIKIGVFFAKDLKINNIYWSELIKLNGLLINQFKRGSEINLKVTVETEKFFEFNIPTSLNVDMVPFISFIFALHWGRSSGKFLFWEINQRKPKKYAKMLSGKIIKIGIEKQVRIIEIKLTNDIIITLFTIWSFENKSLFGLRDKKYTIEDLNQLKDIVFGENLLTDYEIKECEHQSIVYLPEFNICSSHCLNAPYHLRERDFMFRYIDDGVITLNKIYSVNKFKLKPKSTINIYENVRVFTINEPFIVSVKNNDGLIFVAEITEPLWANS